jgi:3-oxoacyl-ACP reductase-like protein
MSEEKPVFKVRDRRLFNPDGTPRDVEREEAERPAPETASTATQATDASATTSQATAQAAPAAPASQSAASEASSSRAAPVSEETEMGVAGEDEAAMGDVPGADDPASFINFLMSIASNAAAALGMMEHPATGQRGVDLQLGKHWIDVLGMLREKTEGNLHEQERQILEGILADLRMQYVSLTSARQARPSGGFTGRDILGGK